MTNQTCDCCGIVETSPAESDAEDEPAVDRWIGDSPVMETPFPEDVRTAMEQFLGAGSIATLEDWVGELRRQTGGPIDVDDLCHADGETAHWGELEGVRYDFRCFYDAVALAELASQPVEIHTTSPGGTEITARATGDGDVTATPSTAVVSFGIVTDRSKSDGKPTLEDAYTSICPAVAGFPTRDAYERWAARTSAATVGLPLSAATTVATGLVEN
ncbi:organomercurial lyase [Natrinema ejinorense]|uniref:Alkylmercury lyase n=1 Tax=Natrinema ejinorense TaxID=373386 RepID=A0A2A5QZ32_9EURY|nr:organomercurial lyase [Natrinema ejinorense]PCR92023.1 alkylmercury lyase [Natrinema ejinorense]